MTTTKIELDNKLIGRRTVRVSALAARYVVVIFHVGVSQSPSHDDDQDRAEPRASD